MDTNQYVFRRGEPLKRYAKEFVYSRHYTEDKEAEADFVIDCVHTGKKKLDAEPNKFKSVKSYCRGDLVVVYKEYDEYFFIITAFWNRRGD